MCIRDRICLEDLRDEPYVSLSETMTRFRVDAAFQAANVTRRLMIEARWSVTVCRFVALGRGVSIIEPFTAHYANHGAVVRPLREEIDFSFTEVRPLHQEERPLLAEFLATMEARLEPFLV